MTLNELGTPQVSPEFRQKQQYPNQLDKETENSIRQFEAVSTTPKWTASKENTVGLLGNWVHITDQLSKGLKASCWERESWLLEGGASSRASGGFPEESSKERNLVSWESHTQPQVQVKDERITEDDLSFVIRERLLLGKFKLVFWILMNCLKIWKW